MYKEIGKTILEDFQCDTCGNGSERGGRNEVEIVQLWKHWGRSITFSTILYNYPVLSVLDTRGRKLTTVFSM